MSKGCIFCKHCYFVKGSAYCTSSKFRASKISEKQLYNKRGYCSGFEQKDDTRKGGETDEETDK